MEINQANVPSKTTQCPWGFSVGSSGGRKLVVLSNNVRKSGTEKEGGERCVCV